MMIIPLSGKVSWKNPPVVTIALIIANCLVFLLFQLEDAGNRENALRYYITSGLARIEVDAYIAQKGPDKDIPAPALKDGRLKLRSEQLAEYATTMFQDDSFMYDLDRGKIITPADGNYKQWSELREEYKKRMSLVTLDRYGFKPADWTITTSFTYMFLHGGVGHLVGNMVFLWLVGCVLEMGCGRLVYSAIYLIGGLCAVSLFGLLNPHSLRPLVGASGAIAAIIGAYLVLYGTRKIKVFYSLGVYFNYTMVPAITILPIFIANEVLQYFLHSFSAVAYMAHVGGLIGGAGLGFMNLALLKNVDTKIFDEDPRDKIPGLLDQALRAMEKLDAGKAMAALHQILAIDPNHGEAITRLYNAARLNPGDEAYDKAAIRLLDHLARDRARAPDLQKVLREYLGFSSHPKIDLDLLVKIGSAFTTGGMIEEAEKIILLLLKTHPEAKQLPRMMLGLARICMDKGQKDKAQSVVKVILVRFPESREAGTARDLINGSRAPG